MLPAVVAAGLLASACSPNGGDTSGAGAGAATGGGGAGGDDAAQAIYPDIAALHERGISRTCSRNQGVCHSARDYPELTTAQHLLDLVGQPCQLGAQTPGSVLDQCESTGDYLVIGGINYEILLVEIASDAPYPPMSVTLKLASLPPSVNMKTAKIRRLDADKKEVLAYSLAGATLAPGGDGKRLVVDLSGSTVAALAEFLDVRAWHGERVRMGDPNDDGNVHTAKAAWGEIVPGDPSRSFFYQRLIGDEYGATMPLVPRTWTPAATRAVWCWIRGLPADASPSSLGVHDAIDYANCPVDPDAPDPNASGGWPAVKLLIGSKCATGPCHSSATKAGTLDLTPTPGGFGKNVINAGAFQASGSLRVVPGQPAASYLLCKVDPSCPSRTVDTEVMPLNGMVLDATEMKLISDWIVNGALTE